jgi:transposase-like protein
VAWSPGKSRRREQPPIQELQAWINRLEREKSILKEATALLMSDEMAVFSDSESDKNADIRGASLAHD